MTRGRMTHEMFGVQWHEVSKVGRAYLPQFVSRWVMLLIFFVVCGGVMYWRCVLTAGGLHGLQTLYLLVMT